MTYKQDICTAIRIEGQRVVLASPAFAFTLDTADGLRAVSWENRLTGRTLALGGGREVEFDLGLPGQPLITPNLRVTGMPAETCGTTGEARFTLEGTEPSVRVTVIYRWDDAKPVLHKLAAIENCGASVWNRLLNVRLGRYETDGERVSDRPSGGEYSVPAPREFPLGASTHVERGFPVYVESEFFFSLAHPAGAAEGATGKVLLRQYPGVRLMPNETFQCMEAVYGVAKAGVARQAFVAHVQGRMRRRVRGHDRAYTIFTNFGSWPSGSFWNTEAYVLRSLSLLAESQKAAGCHFDLCNVDFWSDYRGTLQECDPERFPNGLERIGQEIDNLGSALGLWIDGSWERWSIGGNPSPEVQDCLNYDCQQPDTLGQVQLGRKAFCRATEPIRSMYIEAFRYHIRQHGARLLKFDNTSCVCVNPKHEHLPGLYSTEAIENGLIDFFQALDAECPDVFLMLYWGYKSPWWLLHADTLFDSGLDMEAASPSDQPAPYLRDSVTQKLDQGQRVAGDVPALGKDSLGIWLSSWPWNSQIGKERWQEGLVMDICRGSLLGQIWSDSDWLSSAEWPQLANLLALLKAQPKCFGNPLPVLGDPRNDEPYGYCCTDGHRAFLALNNATWEDRVVALQLNPAWGLPAGQRWDLYRWYPHAARLAADIEGLGSTVEMAMRPFEVVLLEAVAHGEAPSLALKFQEQPVPLRFAEPSQPVHLTMTESGASPALWAVSGEIQASADGGMLAVVVELTQEDGHPCALHNLGSFFTAEATVAGSPASVQPAVGLEGYPSSWQTWRLDAPAAASGAQFNLSVACRLAADMRLSFRAYFIPRAR